jgi:AcrR family transcriptional regulator
MGRPKEHDKRTAEALLDAAERIVTAEGVEALSVRRVADDVGTTTRAVYSLFGSKDGLLVALGARAFDMLGVAITTMPRTTNPSADLIEAGVAVFRNFAVGHPSLFRIAVQRSIGSPGLSEEFAAAATRAFLGLMAHVARLEIAGMLGPRTVRDAATEFQALCEGLAALELRGQLTTGDNEQIWRDALTALVTGFSAAPRDPAPKDSGGRQASTRH